MSILVATMAPTRAQAIASRDRIHAMTGGRWPVIYTWGPLVGAQRDELVRNFLESKAYKLLFWDADIVAAAEHVEMLDKRDLPIVGGRYAWRLNPSLPCAGKIGATPTGEDCNVHNDHGCVQVAWVGAGFLMVHRDVFLAMEPPWFMPSVVRDMQTGEDVGFCLAAGENGFEVWLDCDCEITHNLEDSMPEEKKVINLDEMSDDQLAALCWKLFKQLEVADRQYRAVQTVWEKRQHEGAKNG